MGIVNRNAIGKDLPKWLRGLGEELKDIALEDGFAVGEMARADIKHTIDTVESALSPGKVGRNWTGHMNSRVDYNIRQTENMVDVSFGWSNLRKAENYIAEQELSSPRVQPGMFSAYAANEKVKRLLADKGYKITNTGGGNVIG